MRPDWKMKRDEIARRRETVGCQAVLETAGVNKTDLSPGRLSHCENRRLQPAGERIEAWRMLVTEC